MTDSFSDPDGRQPDYLDVPGRIEPPNVRLSDEPSTGLPGIPEPSRTAAAPGAGRLTPLMSLLALMLMLSFFLPYTVEKITYAVARGRQRAEYETAGEQLQNAPLSQLSKAYQLVAHRVGPSVVHINVVSGRASPAGRSIGTLGKRHRPTDQGSGVIIDKDGYILTNRHVVGNAVDIQIKLSDGRQVPAKVVGVDRETDLAVLKITATDLMPAQWGDSDQIEVGALVWALGSPFGLERTVTFGILSAKHRSGILSARGHLDETAVNYQDFLQTDAAVNPGNSGGPLVDSQGRLVGINTAIAGEWYQGISFAIPSSVAKPIYDRLRRHGRVQRGWLGVEPREITPELAKQLGLPDRQGAFVAKVVSELDGAPSPAQQAGIKPNDVIIRWGGKPVSSRTELFERVALAGIGATIDVVVIRDGARKTLQVLVGARPNR